MRRVVRRGKRLFINCRWQSTKKLPVWASFALCLFARGRSETVMEVRFGAIVNSSQVFK